MTLKSTWIQESCCYAKHPVTGVCYSSRQAPSVSVFRLSLLFLLLSWAVCFVSLLPIASWCWWKSQLLFHSNTLQPCNCYFSFIYSELHDSQCCWIVLAPSTWKCFWRILNPTLYLCLPKFFLSTELCWIWMKTFSIHPQNFICEGRGKKKEKGRNILISGSLQCLKKTSWKMCIDSLNTHMKSTEGGLYSSAFGRGAAAESLGAASISLEVLSHLWLSTSFTEATFCLCSTNSCKHTAGPSATPWHKPGQHLMGDQLKCNNQINFKLKHT